MSESTGTIGPAGRLRSFHRDGLTFDLLDEGPIDGDPVVLLHGFPERASCWRDIAPRLHAQGLRTFAPDQRGYSPRARPPRRRDYTGEQLEADIVALIGAIGRPVHLVGHDWGALVGWLVAAHHPDRVRSWTAVSVPHPAAFIGSMRQGQARKSWYMAAFQTPRIPERLARKPGGRFDQSLRGGGMTRDDVARFRREIVDHGALTGGLNWYRAMPFGDRHRLHAPVTVPTTMVWSDGDAFIGRTSIDLVAQHVAGPYDLVVLEGVTHWIPTQAAEPLAEAILARIGTV